MRSMSTRSIALILVAFSALAITPYWVVTIPPGTDLPQHLSQIVLAQQVLSGERTDMAFVPWYFPQTLIYAVVWVAMSLSPALTAGKLVMSFLVASWLAATCWLTVRLKRPFASWMIISTVVFNFLFSWGLLNFLIALPLLCVFVERISSIRENPRPIPTDFLVLSLLYLALYYAHSLVFLFSNLLACLLALPRAGRHLRPLVLTAAPAWILVLFWYPTLASLRTASGANVSAGWISLPWERLAINELTDNIYGAVHNPIEQGLTVLLLCWTGAALLQHRCSLRRSTHGPLALCGGLLIGMSLILPDHYMNTIMFSTRWTPIGTCFLLLALPAPKLPKPLAFALAGGSLTLLSAITTAAWTEREHTEQDGLLEAIQALTPQDKLLSFSNVGSIYIKGEPDLQISAFAQALLGCEIQFSFAEHYSGIVYSTVKRERIVKSSDVWAKAKEAAKSGEFTAILVGSDARNHQLIASKLGLENSTSNTSTWRLYRFIPAK